MGDRTYKDLLGDGYTTYHDDGTTSHTQQNVLDDGWTTYHSDGSTSYSHQNVLDDGWTTHHSDGSTSYSHQNVLDDGWTTHHSGGGSYGYGSAGTPGGYSGYSGYSGYPSSGGGVCKMGLGDCLALAVLIGGPGYVAWRYALEFSWPLAACFLLAYVHGIVERNVRCEYGRQEVWYRWCRILATLFGVFFVRMTAPIFVGIELVEEFVVLGYLFWEWIVLAALDALPGLGWLVDALVMIAAAVACYMGHGVDPAFYYICYDALFAILLLRAILNLRRAARDCRSSLYVFPVVLFALCVAASKLVGVYGWTFLVDAVSRLVG